MLTAATRKLADVKLPTFWNQIEAAMAYTRGLPLMVIVENGIKNEGLLERGNEWYVQRISVENSALNSAEFNGVLASWKQKMIHTPAKPARAGALSDLTISELIGGLKPAQLWAILVALAAVIAGAFTLGAKV